MVKCSVKRSSNSSNSQDIGQMVKEHARDLKAILQETDLTKSKTFLKTFVKRIDIEGDKATIHYTLPVPPQGQTNETVSVLPMVTQTGEGGTRTPTPFGT
jgi:site-specific DNA recombinase